MDVFFFLITAVETLTKLFYMQCEDRALSSSLLSLETLLVEDNSHKLGTVC